MSARRWATVAGALTLTACASFVGVFVSQQDTLRVPHARHLEADVDCATCHETIFDSTSLEIGSFPKEKTCLGCHKKEKADCAFCHTQPDKPLPIPARVRDLKMNHTQHIERLKEDCSACHKNLPNPFRTEGMAPTMEGCLSCHNHRQEYEAGKCEVCHKDLTKYKLEPVGDFSHRGGWLKGHGVDARSAGANCSTCHEQTFCSECHAKTVAAQISLIMPERVDRAFIHRHDFASRHMVEARADEASCQRCHGLNFCQACHAKSGLNPASGTTLDPHPVGFGDGMVHGPAARRDIVSCAACHDQGAASNCVSCHKVGGIAGNPHPPAWTVRHNREEIGRNAMCQVCHL